MTIDAQWTRYVRMWRDIGSYAGLRAGYHDFRLKLYEYQLKMVQESGWLD